MTTVNDFSDILRIIREQPEWADALRGALLSQDLLELPQQFAEFVKAADKRFAALESDVADLKEGQARLEAGQARLEAGQARLEAGYTRLEVGYARLEESQASLEAGQARLEGEVGNIRGAIYEQKIGNNIASIVGQHMGIRRVRVLKGYKVSDEMVFHDDIIYPAQDRGVISEQERIEVASADIVLRGQRHPDQATVYVIIEVSLTVAESDINRADSRAGIMRRATGEVALSVVIGAHVDGARQQLARERNVNLITVGA